MELRPDHRFDPFGPDAAAYDGSDSLDISNIDFRHPPPSFFEGIGVAPPVVKSPGDVHREATTRSKEIFINYNTLHEILVRHEVTIQKRWFKKKNPAPEAKNPAECLAEYARSPSPGL